MSHIHFIGIGGAGLSAIATVLLEQGYRVSGSDKHASAATARLEQLGATIYVGQRPQNLRARPETVVISSAIAGDNPELVAARKLGLTVVKRDEWLGRMMAGYDGIAIAGTHGKTTTTSLTAFMLDRLGQDPTYIVGGYVPQLKANAAAGRGRAFVVEADEYDHMFLGLRPKVAVITYVEWDHPDIFPTPESLHQAFFDFVRLVPGDGLIIGCGDAPGVREVLVQANAPVVTYGLKANNDWRAIDLISNRHGGFDFKVVSSTAGKVPLASVSLAVPGQHNVANATAVVLIAHQLGLDLRQAAAVISEFTGVERRFQLKGERKGITVIDDYAHHPTEIKATLAAARTRFGERPIWAIFQPHTFSRTRTLLVEFAGAFAEADHVIVLDIYPSREKDDGRVSSRDVVMRMSHPDVGYIGPLSEAADYLIAHVTAPAVLITLGAGNGYLVGEWVLEKLSQ